MSKETQQAEFFADTSKISEISRMTETDLFSGITTNPLIVAKECAGINPTEIISYYENLAKKFPGIPISIQLLDKPLQQLIKDAREFSKISPEIVIKIPMFADSRGLILLA